MEARSFRGSSRFTGGRPIRASAESDDLPGGSDRAVGMPYKLAVMPVGYPGARPIKSAPDKMTGQAIGTAYRHMF